MKKSKENKKNILKEAWHDPKKRAGIKLLMWVIFLLLVFLLASISGNNGTNIEEKKDFSLYSKMISNLENNDYSYTYKITTLDQTIIFDGQKKDGTQTGTKETSEGIIKYLIENDISYKLVLENKEEYDIYENLNKNYLEMNDLFNILKNYQYNLITNKDTRTYTYNLEKATVVVTTNLEKITNILITEENTTYDLTIN